MDKAVSNAGPPIDLKLDEGELEALTLCDRLKVRTFLTDDLNARDAGKQL